MRSKTQSAVRPHSGFHQNAVPCITRYVILLRSTFETSDTRSRHPSLYGTWSQYWTTTNSRHPSLDGTWFQYWTTTNYELALVQYKPTKLLGFIYVIQCIVPTNYQVLAQAYKPTWFLVQAHKQIWLQYRPTKNISCQDRPTKPLVSVCLRFYLIFQCSTKSLGFSVLQDHKTTWFSYRPTTRLGFSMDLRKHSVLVRVLTSVTHNSPWFYKEAHGTT